MDNSISATNLLSEHLDRVDLDQNDDKAQLFADLSVQAPTP